VNLQNIPRERPASESEQTPSGSGSGQGGGLASVDWLTHGPTETKAAIFSERSRRRFAA